MCYNEMNTTEFTMELKTPYEKPLIEVLSMRSENVMTPASWNTGEGGNLPIHEGDPDPDDDGRGAKDYNWDGTDNIWD